MSAATTCTIGRLAGGLLLRTAADEYYLVGDLKEPCDFGAAGFADPGEIRATERSFVPLAPVDQTPRRGVAAAFEPPYLAVRSELPGPQLAEQLHARLVIQRNASVSERLWGLIVLADENDGQDEIDATWLFDMPAEIWEIVRDNVLRCV